MTYKNEMEALKTIGALEYLLKTRIDCEGCLERMLELTDKLTDIISLYNGIDDEIEDDVDYDEEFKSDIEADKKRDWEDLHGDSGAIY